MTEPYASEEETRALLRKDTRTPAERKLDRMLKDRGASEQGAEPTLILRQIALELLADAAQGCNYCNHALYAGTKCKNCGRVTEQAAIKRDLTPEQPAQQEPIGELTMGGIVDTSSGPEYGDWDAEWDTKAVEALQERLVTGDAPVTVSLYTSPPAQQEPVAWLVCENWRKHSLFFTEEGAEDFKNAAQREDDLSGNLARWKAKPLYTSPPASKPWVGLDHDDIHALMNEYFYEGMQPSAIHFANFARAIEAKLKEKNT